MRYRATFDDEGDWTPQRDARYVRIRVSTEAEEVGLWMGSVDRRTIATTVPNGDESRRQFWRAAPVTLALTVLDAFEHDAPDSWRSWSRGAREV